MAEFPERIQNKILAYTVILSSRFPPSINYYRISNKYGDPVSALNDLTPLNIIYTSDDSEPIESSIIYIDQAKNVIFNGGGSYYHLFDSSSRSLGKAIQVSKFGVVLKISTGSDGPTPQE